MVWFLKYLLQCQKVSSEKKQLMTSVEATEILKKSLGSIIARTEAQKLAEAIAKDPSLAKFIDIPVTKVIFCMLRLYLVCVKNRACLLF